MALRAGAVFKFRNPDYPEKCRPHIVVVVTPQRKVLYVAVSTKVKHIQERCRNNAKVCVLAPIAECPALDEDSAIDCNSFYTDEEYILTRADSFEILTRGEASLDLLNRIKGGLLKSNNTDNLARKIIMDAASGM